ncbi:MAG: 50S ribosomal protein L17, partial [Bacteroidota bacterium]
AGKPAKKKSTRRSRRGGSKAVAPAIDTKATNEEE